MALIETLFSEYPDGAPADWTDFWGTGDFTAVIESNAAGTIKFGTKWLKYEGSADDRSVLTWDDLGSMSDVCIVAKVRYISIANNGLRLYVRVGGTDADEDAYVLYMSWTTFGITKYKDGVGTGLDSESFYSYAGGEYWIKFQVIGTSVKAKIWNADSVEPEDWILEATDSDIASGAVGVGAYDSFQDFSIDYIGVDSSEIGLPVAYEDDIYFKTTTTSSSSNTFINSAFAMGGYFRDTNRKLKGIRIWCKDTHDDQIRVAVYSGGNLITGPQGSTLLKDFGLTSGVAVDQWVEINTTDDIDIPVDTPLWIVVKGDNAAGFKVVYTTKDSHCGNFQFARGRTSVTAIIGNDPDVAFADTFPAGTDTFGNYWFLLGIKTEDSSITTTSTSTTSTSTTTSSSTTSTSSTTSSTVTVSTTTITEPPSAHLVTFVISS